MIERYFPQANVLLRLRSGPIGLDRDRWQRDQQQLIECAGLEEFVDPRKTLKELDDALYEQYLTTNQNIDEGKNPSTS